MSNFDATWNRTIFNNTHTNIKSNEYVMTEVKKFCLNYLQNVSLANIRDVQEKVNDVLIIVIQYFYDDGLIRSTQLRFDLDRRNKCPHSVQY